MVFSSSLFLLAFLPIFLLIYLVIPYKWKNYWALIASVAFYAWGAPKFIFVLFASTLIDFSFIKYGFDSKHSKKIFWISILLNVALLSYFKYANFFVDNFNQALLSLGFESISWTRVALPIGISFFTFQKISYLVDVYRKVQQPLKKFSDHLLYVILFPQLIAGPIVRYNEIAQEITNRKDQMNPNNRLLGLFRFAIGLGKKVIIANVLGKEADILFGANYEALNSAQVWYATICYTFQIYFDFSGYSDMAIGLGKMMGFNFPENFKNPYTAKSITEFWRRWHVTLSNWMRDYLYIPLGGNRVTKVRLYTNLWIVFLISGLWHGASWTFVFWGAYHGFFLVIERLFLAKLYAKMPSVIRITITFFLVMIGWIFFRADSFEQAWYFVQKMFEFQIQPSIWKDKTMLAILFASLFAFYGAIPKVEKWQEHMLNRKLNYTLSTLYPIVSLILITISISIITTTNFNPFIYFRF